VLPDFPAQKAILRKRVNAVIQAAMRKRHPMIAIVRPRQQHEGRSFTVSQGGTTPRPTEFLEVSSTVTLRRSSVADMREAEVESLLLTLVDDLARQQAESLLEELSTAAEQGSRAVQSGTGPLTPELLLQTLERIDVSFDESGQPRMPTALMPPDAAAKLLEEGPAWEKDPEFQRRWNEIMARKREEFRVREASRKLVD
jgi:hypothetical protein